MPDQPNQTTCSAATRTFSAAASWVPYHTHTFEIPSATKEDVEAGVRTDVAVIPASLGSAGGKDTSYFATAAQGAKADSALQAPGGNQYQFLMKSSAVTNDVEWRDPAEISLVSYNPQSYDASARLQARTNIGLGSVDNTSDANKPISNAVQTALNGKASSAQGAKADTAVQSVAGKTGTDITLAKGDVGLGNVDNTADLAKPISTATQTALNGKATTAQGAKADTALQAPGGSAGQVLTKNSAADNDVGWQTVAAATAVSYAPQTLTTEQQEQALSNLGVTPFARTILDDTTGAAMWATMGASGGTGWERLPNGKIYQWGYRTNPGGDHSFALPIAFPNSFEAFGVTPDGATIGGQPGQSLAFAADRTALSALTVRPRYINNGGTVGAATQNYSWWAKGY